MKSGQITIKDIANELNISPSTVSRALKDHPDISQDTKKAVKELAERLNYQPNSIALSLRKSKTNTIGIIIPELVHHFFSTVISGIEHVAYGAGYNVMICQSNENYEREKTDTRALVCSRVDGLIASVSKATEDITHFADLYNRGYPLVFFDRVAKDLDTSRVTMDDFQGAYEATQHLIKDCGRKQILHLAGPANLNISNARSNGYRAAMQEHGITVQDWMVHHADLLPLAQEYVGQILAQGHRPDGIFAVNDLSAIGATKAVQAAGLRIPVDVSVVGFGDDPIASLYEPNLTTVEQSGFAMGQKAAELLLAQIGVEEEVPSQQLVLPPQLVVRNSSLPRA